MKNSDARDLSPVPCNECIFKVLQDNDAFFCVRHAPVAQAADGRAQFPRLFTSGEPKFKGCGDGRRKKDVA